MIAAAIRNGARPFDVLRLDAAVRGPAPSVSPGDIAIVMVVTGFGDVEAHAILRLLSVRNSLVEAGWRVRVVVVQNDLTVETPTRSACRVAGFGCVVIRNRGFSDANCAGVRACRFTPDGWVVFTQADAHFDARSVLDGVALATANGAVVGPSGGMCRGWPGPHPLVIEEYGRNIERTRLSPAAWVDFVAGYWVLARVRDYARSGGWNRGYFLYFEDVDLGMAFGSSGTRCLVDPSLAVDHRRGATIRAVMTDDLREEIRVGSRARFVRRWAKRCGGDPRSEPPCDSSYSASLAVRAVDEAVEGHGGELRWLDLGAYDGGGASLAMLRGGVTHLIVSTSDPQAVPGVTSRVQIHPWRSRVDVVTSADPFATHRPPRSADVVWVDDVRCPDDIPPLREAVRLADRFVAVHPSDPEAVAEHLSHLGATVTVSEPGLVLARVACPA